MLRPNRDPDRRRRLVAAIEPIVPAVRRLSEAGVLARLAAALPTEDRIAPADNHGDINGALYPVRLEALLAAGEAGAAHLIDNGAAGALWAWEVDDPTWEAALLALDVAMHVAILDTDGLPVTPGMRATHRLVLELAAAPPGATPSGATPS